MSIERPSAASDACESGEKSVAEVNARLRELLDSLREAVRELPQVFVNGEPYTFSLEQEPDLVRLAEVQLLKSGLEQELARLREPDAGKDPTTERMYGLALGFVSAIEEALKHRSDAVVEAERVGRQGQALVTTFDTISERFLATTDTESTG